MFALIQAVTGRAVHVAAANRHEGQGRAGEAKDGGRRGQPGRSDAGQEATSAGRRNTARVALLEILLPPEFHEPVLSGCRAASCRVSLIAARNAATSWKLYAAIS